MNDSQNYLCMLRNYLTEIKNYLCMLRNYLTQIILPLCLLPACTVQQHGFIGTSGGGKVYYEQRGKGETVILLHGHSLDRRMWDCQWKPLAKKFRTVRMDFRGYGLSSEQREDMPMTHADDVLALMDSLHIGQAHVVGLSMGAFVAGDLLAMHPERLLSCTMASGGIRNSPEPSVPMDSAESAKRDREIAALQAKGVAKMKEEWTEQLMSSGGSQRERMRKPLTQMISDWTAWQPLHKEVRLFYGREAWQRLQQRGKTNVPTLMVRGENEVKGNKNKPREMQYLTRAEFTILPDCGHMLNMEQPEQFNKVLLDFLLSNCQVR